MDDDEETEEEMAGQELAEQEEGGEGGNGEQEAASQEAASQSDASQSDSASSGSSSSGDADDFADDLLVKMVHQQVSESVSRRLLLSHPGPVLRRGGAEEKKNDAKTILSRNDTHSPSPPPPPSPSTTPSSLPSPSPPASHQVWKTFTENCSNR